jgi:hypothetical protein
MQFYTAAVTQKRGIAVTKSIAINVGRAQNAVPDGTSATTIFFEEDRRKAGSPLPWVVTGAYNTVIASLNNYTPGLSVTLAIEKFDRKVAVRNQLLSVDNISYVVTKPGDVTKSIIFYEWINKFELIEIEVDTDFATLVSILNGTYSS